MRGQFRRKLLTEQAGDMLPCGREAVVDGRRDEDFNDGLLRPAIALRIQKRAVHIIQCWRDDDARLMVLARFG